VRSVKTTYFPLKGGFNVVTPPIQIPDGMCRDTVNFDADLDGGYRYIAGYERYDGREQPSDAVYYTIQVTDFATALTLGQTITGQTSGAVGYIVGYTATAISLTKITGTFQSGEILMYDGSSITVSLSTANIGGASSTKLNATYKANAADVYRNLIQPITGSGDILGVWRYNGTVYAFRNNTGGTQAIMWKESPTGWTQVSLGYEVPFSNANTDVNVGDTLTQGSVTATINKVIVETGTLASGTNTGKLIITTPSGGVFAVGAATSTGSGALQLSAPSSEITLLPDGRFNFVNYNFGGALNTLKMYGADGVNRAFEFDGTIFVPIKTGMATDTPKFIAAHTNRLFLSFNTSLQYSAVGDQYSFNAVIGAGELAMGDEITCLTPMIGSDASAALAVFTRNRTSILYGSSASDFNLVVFSYESGAIPFSAQYIGQVYIMDELGLRQIGATQGFGNFLSSQITKYIKPWIASRIGKTVGSTISRLKNQYRIYFNDRFGLHVTVDNEKIVGIMPIQVAHTFTCMCSLEDGAGDEYILAGSNNGYVYRLEKGTSFDGTAINAYFVMNFNHLKSPRMRKRYRKAVFEVTGTDYSEFQAGYEIGYGSNDISQGIAEPFDIQSAFGGVYWDAFTWDNFYWDGKSLLPAEYGLTGSAENISLAIRATSKFMQSFTINSVILHFSDGRLLR
jgi:hypothetical protein